MAHVNTFLCFRFFIFFDELEVALQVQYLHITKQANIFSKLEMKTRVKRVCNVVLNLLKVNSK